MNIDEMKDKIARAEEIQRYTENRCEALEKENAELEAQIEQMKKELHHRLVSHSKSDSDCLDEIIGLDRLWQFGEEF
jgi:chromosome segregation ATPase